MKKLLSIVLTVLILLLGCLPMAFSVYAIDMSSLKHLVFDSFPGAPFTDFDPDSELERTYCEAAFAYQDEFLRSLGHDTVGVSVTFFEKASESPEYLDFVAQYEAGKIRETAYHEGLKKITEEHNEKLFPAALELLGCLKADDAVAHCSGDQLSVSLTMRLDDVVPETIYGLFATEQIRFVCFMEPEDYRGGESLNDGYFVPYPVAVLTEVEPNVYKFIPTEEDPVEIAPGVYNYPIVRYTPEPGFFENVWNNVLSFFARIGDFFASLFR